jgi:hypothetical protein
MRFRRHRCRANLIEFFSPKRERERDKEREREIERERDRERERSETTNRPEKTHAEREM